jgi:predicted alpha/beta superfamily hydrolase
MKSTLIATLLAATLAGPSASQQSPVDFRPDPPIKCASCDAWNGPHEAFQIFGNTYYVGVAGLSSVLISSDQGHILIDGGLPQSAAVIDRHIRALGFRTEDVKLILASHEHYDHVGGIAALARASGPTVVASAATARALRQGEPNPDDPQYGFGHEQRKFPAVASVRVAADGETVRVGTLAVTAHATPGHTPGSTTWSWRSCEGTRCLDVVYADSLNAVSSDDFRFTDHPGLVERFRKSIETVRNLPGDVWLAVHPGFAAVDDKLAQRKARADAEPFVDRDGFRRYAENAMRSLEKRVQEERSPTAPLTIGDTFTIESAVLHETRRINVYVPPMPYGTPADTPLPVLYMPDGGLAEDFLHVAGLVQVSVGNATMRPFMLVGIENTQRRRDLTGPTDNAEDKKIAPVVGGSAAFRTFIRSELIPAIDARYRTTSERAIIGESLAGLFTVETFLVEPDLFDTYIAFDASLWWNDGALEKDAARRIAAIRSTPAHPKTLFLATSREDRGEFNAALYAALTPQRPAWLTLVYEPMPAETHATIYHPAALISLRRLFKPAG